MTNHPVEGDALLTPAEVAALFRVDPKTVTRWARAGSPPHCAPWAVIGAIESPRSVPFSAGTISPPEQGMSHPDVT